MGERESKRAWSLAWVIHVALIGLAAPSLTAAQEAARDIRNSARVLATAGINGRFGEAMCVGDRTVQPHEASAFTGSLVHRAEGADAPLIVDTGGLLAPHGVARFAARDLPEVLADLVTQLGYDTLAFGENDMGAPRPRTIELARVLSRRGVPYVASNLRCDEEGSALCEVVVDASDPSPLVATGNERAAFLAFLDPEVLARVAPDRSIGLRVDPIADSLPTAVRAARAAGATLVIAVLDVTSDEAFALARGLPDDGRPDLVLIADEGDDLLFARPASVVPALVAPPLGHGVEVLVGESDELQAGFEMLAVPLEAEGETAAPPVHAFAAAVGPAYCRAWGRALAGGRLAREIDAPSVAGLAAQIVREFAGADVAFLNVQAIDDSFRAADPAQLSASDFYIALEYDEPLVVADVPGRWLQEVLDGSGAHPLLTPGLGSDGADEDPQIRVRGRAPVPGATYHVVTIRFLAEGGDGALPSLPEGSTWRTLEYTETDGSVRYRSLRDVVIAALEPPDARDPRDARPSPDDAPEWVVRGGADGDFAGSSVSNPAEYDAALLATDTSIAMGLEVALHVDATAPLFTWENLILGRYRTQWAPSAEPGAQGQFVEATDQVQLRTMGSYRGLRATPSDVWVPDPYVELFVESEITRPDTRDWHWLLVRPTVGARFPLTPEFEVKLQVGFQTQALEPGAEAGLGAGATLLLRPWTILEVDERSLTLEGLADFFAFDLFDRNLWQLRGQLDLALDLAGPLALTFGATLYLQQDGEQPLGAAFTATCGLRLAAVTRVIGP